MDSTESSPVRLKAAQTTLQLALRRRAVTAEDHPAWQENFDTGVVILRDADRYRYR